MGTKLFAVTAAIAAAFVAAPAQSQDINRARDIIANYRSGGARKAS